MSQNPNNEGKRVEEDNKVSEGGGSFKDRINVFEPKSKQPQSNPKPKAVPKSKKERIKLEEKGDLTIYEYQNADFSISNSKKVLIIGNAKNDFIKTFINICSNISYKDKERFSIKANENKEIIIYKIKSKTKEKINITFISIPHLDKDDIALKKDLIELLKDKAKKINLIFFAFDENKVELDDYEKIFYTFFINIFNFRNKLLFLISLNQSSDNNHKYTIHQFLNSDNYFLEEKNVLNPDYFSINNKIIFESNESDWKQLSEKIEIIKN